MSWINHLPPACWSTFRKSNSKQQLGCRFDIMDYESYFFVFWHMQLYMSWYIISFFGFTFLNIFIFSSTLVLTFSYRRNLYTFYSSIKTVVCRYGDSHMRIPILVRWHLYIEMAPIIIWTIDLMWKQLLMRYYSGVKLITANMKVALFKFGCGWPMIWNSLNFHYISLVFSLFLKMPIFKSRPHYQNSFFFHLFKQHWSN